MQSAGKSAALVFINCLSCVRCKGELGEFIYITYI